MQEHILDSTDWKLGHLTFWMMYDSEAVVERCSYEQVFQKSAANLQENTHAEMRLQ